MPTSKSLFKITFTDEEDKTITVHAEEVSPSSLLGFIEAAELVFPDPSDIIITPADNKARTLFKDVKRTYIPINRIIRIDELSSDKKTPVITLINQGKQTDI